MPVPAAHVRGLHRYEHQILIILERLMRKYRWVPLDLLKRASGLSDNELSYRLGRLMEWGMVRYDTVPYDGYSLIFGGYDTLALLTLTKRGTVSALGSQIGEGKESVVYEGLGLGSIALKFHHVGQRSFQSVRINREYIPESGFCPWLLASRYSADREFEALKRLHPAVSVPLPIDQNRHIVVMEYIEGETLTRCRPEDPASVLQQILRNVTAAYERGVIHADLSEYNVMISDSRIVLIDWPQWIEQSHENADELLRRDLGNILEYFWRKYRLPFDLDAVVMKVTG
jgi:RIO kinase 2